MLLQNWAKRLGCNQLHLGQLPYWFWCLDPLNLVHTVRGVAEIDIRFDASSLAVGVTQMCGKCFCFVVFNKVYGAAAESSAGEACSDAARFLLGKINEDVGLRATGFKIIAIAGVSFVHEPAQGLEIAGFESIGSGNRAGVLGDDVPAALEDIGTHFMTPFPEILHGGVAQQLDFGAMAP